MQKLLSLQADVVYHPAFISASECQSYFDEIKRNANWQQHQVKIFGKTHQSPRLSAWYGDAGARYKYSGVWYEPEPWLPQLVSIRDQIRLLADTEFNSCLLNYYRNGDDCMGFHSDNEPTLGPQPVIASVSFGAERKFTFKHKTKKAENVSVMLGDGDVLIMKGDTQHYWQHGIARTKKPVGERVNLTFRAIQPAKK